MKYKYILFTIFIGLIVKSQIANGSFEDADIVYYDNFGKPNDILALDDGKFLIFAKYNNQGVIYRLNPNGTIDQNFGSNGKVVISESSFLISDVKSIAIQSNDKILYNQIGANNYATQNKFGRLNADGSVDSNFSSSWFGINSSTYFNSPKLMPNDKIMATYYNGNGTGIVRYNSDGSLDTTFGLNGIYSTSNTLYRFLNVLSNDYILISNSSGGTIGIYTNGIIGNSNNINSAVIQSFIYNNQLYLINRGKISRLNTNVNLDMGFGNNGSTTFSTFSIYGDTIYGDSGNIFQLSLQDTQQNIKISKIDGVGLYQGEYIKEVSNLGNLQIGKLLINSTNDTFYALISGTETDKCALVKISNPNFFLSIEDNDISSKVKFFPNPVKEIIEFTDYINTIYIYDSSGKKVFYSNKKMKSLNIGFLQKGVYWLNAVDSESIKFRKKIIKN